MGKREVVLRAAAVCSLLVFAGTSPASGSGFGIFEQGSKAMGMAGAFTAQADDPSAMFHNVGGLAFFTDSEVSVGLTYITAAEAEFTGANPFPGAGVFTEQETLSEFPPHLYWVKPLPGAWNFGLAVNAPFGLSTEWPEDFSGRFISTFGSLRTIDVNPNVGIQLTERLGLGFGPILRFSDVELRRHQAAVNPFTLTGEDVAMVRLESDFESDWGWQVGLLHRATDRFSWGASYRSTVEITFNGDANFTQIPTGSAAFDALVGQLIPFDRAVPIATAVEFPDMASVGVAVGLTDRILVEVDANWAGWSNLQEVVIDFTDGSVDPSVLDLRWEDSNNYRLGLRWTGSGSEWRFGYVFDENPIPDETLGPLLPDSDRNGFTVGWGKQLNRGELDLALMYLPFDERTTTVSEDGFFGTYSQTAWLFGATVSF